MGGVAILGEGLPLSDGTTAPQASCEGYHVQIDTKLNGRPEQLCFIYLQVEP
jgi:hypothetical protein